MTEKKTEPGTALAVVSNIAEARKKKAEHDNDMAPLEAVEPQAIKLDGSDDDWLISGCDGEQTFVWLATRPKRRKTFKVVEVYPGLSKKRVAGQAKEDASTKPEDLVVDGNFKHISDVLEELSEFLFEGFEMEETGSES